MQFGVRTLCLRTVVTSHQSWGTFWRLVVALWTQHKGLEGSRQTEVEMHHTHTPVRSPQPCLTFSVLPPADQWMRPNPSNGQELSCGTQAHVAWKGEQQATPDYRTSVCLGPNKEGDKYTATLFMWEALKKGWLQTYHCTVHSQ